MKAGPLSEQRRKTHGDWAETARITCEVCAPLNAAMKRRIDRGVLPLEMGQIAALTAITGKIARIISGDPDYADHWDDIAGYAALGKGGAV